jgi:hypothetical protein
VLRSKTKPDPTHFCKPNALVDHAQRGCESAVLGCQTARSPAWLAGKFKVCEPIRQSAAITKTSLACTTKGL